MQYPPSFRTRRHFSKTLFNATSPFLMCFPYSVPPLRSAWGNPRNCSAGGNTRYSHNKDISLIMPPSFVWLLRNNTSQSDGTNRQARRSMRSALRASSSEYAHTVNKYAPNWYIARISSLRLGIRQLVHSIYSRTAVSIPFSNEHIPLISTPWISLRLDKATPSKIINY